jgi:inosine-uridine nucleoside N-ribohydrolase
MNNTEKYLIIDTDPGVDDALSLAMLSNILKKNNANIIFSSIGGNTSLINTHKNLINILSDLQISYKHLLKGSDSTLLGEKFTDAEHYHGKEGLTLKLNNSNLGTHNLETYEYIHEIYNSQKNANIKLLLLGPLTNLAKALISFPEISSIIDEVIVMGGAFFTGGNATKYAEFNIYADAESASIVFDSKLNIRVVGLDVCNDLTINKNKFYNNEYSFLKSNTKSSEFSKNIINSFFKYHINKSAMSLCDPIATICLIEKNLFSYKNCSVKVITEGDRMGQTIPVSDNNNSNVQIAHKIDETKIWNLINQLFIR